MADYQIPTRRFAMYHNCENCKHWHGDEKRPDPEFPWLRRCDVVRDFTGQCWNTAADATCNKFEWK